ncbi:hypothetical protein B0H14DRAFT_3897778 [Mycena olivaceomarginata]|nr:hypothetical protein B0H14DRAFT_3897778 [Mycena olivaceomarginata]
MRGRVGVGAALLVTPGVEKRDASLWMRHHAQDCDWARVTGSGTRQRKREKDGFLFNSYYLHAKTVCGSRARLDADVHIEATSVVPSLYSGAPGGWSTWRQQAKSEGARREDAHRTAPAAARTSGAACRRVNVDTQLVRVGGAVEYRLDVVQDEGGGRTHI